MSKIEFETFRDIGSYEISNLTSKVPSSFNGYVRVRKYKITIELIEEPIEVIQERLSKLWHECDNCHQRQPLQATALKYGLELNNGFGKDRVR